MEWIASDVGSRPWSKKANLFTLRDDPDALIGGPTFAFWNHADGGRWCCSFENYWQEQMFLFDGAQEVLSILLGSAQDYRELMMERIEVEIPISQIEFFFRNEPLDAGTLSSMPGSMDTTASFAACREIGYPVAST